MSLHLGMPNAHRWNSEQQQEIREARRLLKERIRTDWDYPPLPRFQLPIRNSKSIDDDNEDDEDDNEKEEDDDNDSDEEGQIAGFKFHQTTTHERDALNNRTPHDLDFEPLEWREREYSTETSSEDESLTMASSNSSKKNSYKFEAPDSIGQQLADRRNARKRKRQILLDEEVTWNDGLAHWLARRDVWCGAHTSAQVKMMSGSGNGEQQTPLSTSASASSTPRTSVSSSTTGEIDSPSETQSSPSTTPDLQPVSAIIETRPPAPPSEILIPIAPTILPNHPIRRRITPDTFPEIYNKIILQSRSPSVPLNLQVLIRALVQGWKDDGEWPPKQGPLEKSIAGRKKHGGSESTLKNGVKAVGRVLRITGGESSVSSQRHDGSEKGKG